MNVAAVMQTWASPALEELLEAQEAWAEGASTTTSTRRPLRASPRRAWTLVALATATRAEKAYRPATEPLHTRSLELGMSPAVPFPLASVTGTTGWPFLLLGFVLVNSSVPFCLHALRGVVTLRGKGPGLGTLALVSGLYSAVIFWEAAVEE